MAKGLAADVDWERSRQANMRRLTGPWMCWFTEDATFTNSPSRERILDISTLTSPTAVVIWRRGAAPERTTRRHWPPIRTSERRGPRHRRVPSRSPAPAKRWWVAIRRRSTSLRVFRSRQPLSGRTRFRPAPSTSRFRTFLCSRYSGWVSLVAPANQGNSKPQLEVVA